MKADYKLKKIIKKEKKDYKTPEGYEDRVAKLLEHLPEKTEYHRLRGFRKMVTVCLAAVLLSATTVAAATMLIHLGNGKLNISNSTDAYKKIVKLKEIRENNGKVNISKVDQGIQFSIENIGLDEGNLIIYYKIKTKNKIKLPGDSHEIKRQRLSYVLMDPEIEVDGKRMENMTAFHELYMDDACTLRGVFRQNMSENLKQKTRIRVNPGRILEKKGNWDIRFTVDRSGVEHESRRILVHRDFVKSVVLSPLGNIMETKSAYRQKDFILQDERGNYLFYKIDSVAEKQNSFYNLFMKTEESKYLKITPIQRTIHTKNRFKLKLESGREAKFSDHSVLRTKKIEKEKQLLRIYFQVNGYDGMNFQSTFSTIRDSQKRKIGTGGVNMDVWMDYEQKLLVFDFYDISGKTDFSKAKYIEFFKQKVIPDQKKAVIIPLES